MNVKPTNKVAAGVLANAIVAVGAWVARDFGGVNVPADTQGMMQIIVTFVVQWWVPDAESA